MNFAKFFAEHQRATASDYRSINSSAGRIVKRNCKWWYKTKAYARVWARSVSYQKGQFRLENRFQKQLLVNVLQLGDLKNLVNSKKKYSVLESLLDKVAGLKACNSIRLQHRCFPVKFAKFLRTPFLKEQLQWLLLRFNSCFQRSPEQRPVRMSAINTRFNWKKVFATAKI